MCDKNRYILESESSEDGKATSALQSPVGVAPPPPLRNIPHQTPEASEASPTVLNFSQHHNQLAVPKQRNSVPKLAADQPGGMTNRHSLPIDLLSSNNPVMVRPIASPMFTSLPRSRVSLDNSELVTVTLPDQRIISNYNTARVVVSAPVSTSTPRAKRTLFQEAADTNLVVSHRASIPSETELRKVEGQGAESKNTDEIAVSSSEVGHGETGSSTAGVVIRTLQSAPEQRKPLRVPSKVLQRNLSHDLSSSQSSGAGGDEESVSSDSDESEKRDKFDASKFE